MDVPRNVSRDIIGWMKYLDPAFKLQYNALKVSTKSATSAGIFQTLASVLCNIDSLTSLGSNYSNESDQLRGKISL